MRHELTTNLADGSEDDGAGDSERAAHGELRRAALQAARHAVLAMRAGDEIGDDAFHRIEEELHWLELADRGPRSEPESR